MKKSLFKVTAPALAIGLALSTQGTVLAAGPNAEAKVKADVKIEQSQFSKGGADVTHRLVPIEKRISSVNFEVAETVAELQAVESLSLAEYLAYEEELNSQFGKIGASTNQLEAVTKKFDETVPEVIAAELAITTAFTQTLEAQNLLDSIAIVEDVPEVDVPTEEPVEVPAEVPVEEPTDMPTETISTQ